MRHLEKKVFRIGFFLAFIVIVVIVLGVLARDSQKVASPPEFLEARKAAAEVSDRIVGLTYATNEKIKAINLSDLGGKQGEARALIQEARANNTEAYTHAFELSRYLQRLAESLSGFSSPDSQRLAYSAVAVELSLVSEFITYTQHLNRFLDNLDRAIATGSLEARSEVRNALSEVNKSTATINRLNREFLAKMKKFDKSL